MGTVLHERARHNDHNHLPTCNHRAKRKASGSSASSSQRNSHHDVARNAEKVPENDELVLENGSQAREMRTISTAAVIHPREMLNKPKHKPSSVKHPLERRYRQKDTMPPRLPPVPAPRHEPTEQVTHEDADSGSDLSDTERLAQPASISDPPLLNLREEVIDPSDLQPSRAPSRSHAVSRDSYPDFLPPPFNSWSLRELAVYLNTDGKNVPRSKPGNQFERYLDRLIQLEWRQILTLHEESSKSLWLVRRRPHFSLSAPKSILQCQRAFPFTLLSSVHPQICNRYPVCTYPQHTHPLTEKRGVSRRSSSETRAHRLNRLSDSSLDHLKRMQAVGNIRNPPTHNPHVNGPTGLDPPRRKSSGGRSRSCGDESKDVCGRMRPERRTEARCVIESKSLDVTSSEKEPAAGRTAAKPKHVEFIFQAQEMT
ncbi:uncharacterized protein fam217bb isoform X1 [Hemibagrus wyckioides]|uniref:uncharacterized protein fam217bb isoform X1 n=1 Tax=Hemibagrus wyckioides TaxID=337641 RepID=UPI00266DB472|nr:uncharacterized protein fam217bb isoform X1 [Hemibagrus wyckioides]